MDTTRPQSRQISQRAAFWIVFTTLSLVCLGFILPTTLQRHAAGRTVEMLQPLLSDDARFRNVMISHPTNGRVFLFGQVNSEADLAAPTNLIHAAQPPVKPGVFVKTATAGVK